MADFGYDNETYTVGALRYLNATRGMKWNEILTGGERLLKVARVLPPIMATQWGLDEQTVRIRVIRTLQAEVETLFIDGLSYVIYDQGFAEICQELNTAYIREFLLPSPSRAERLGRAFDHMKLATSKLARGERTSSTLAESPAWHKRILANRMLRHGRVDRALAISIAYAANRPHHSLKFRAVPRSELARWTSVQSLFVIAHELSHCPHVESPAVPLARLSTEAYMALAQPLHAGWDSTDSSPKSAWAETVDDIVKRAASKVHIEQREEFAKTLEASLLGVRAPGSFDPRMEVQNLLETGNPLGLEVLCDALAAAVTASVLSVRNIVGYDDCLVICLVMLLHIELWKLYDRIASLPQPRIDYGDMAQVLLDMNLRVRMFRTTCRSLCLVNVQMTSNAQSADEFWAVADARLQELTTQLDDTAANYAAAIRSTVLLEALGMDFEDFFDSISTDQTFIQMLEKSTVISDILSVFAKGS